MPYLTLPHSQGSPAQPWCSSQVSYRSLLPPDPVFLVLFTFIFPQQMSTGRDGQKCVHGGIQQGLEWPQPFPSHSTAWKIKTIPLWCSQNIYAEQTWAWKYNQMGHKLCFCWVFLLFGFVFSFFFFVLSQAGPKSLSSAPAEAVQDLWSHNNREGTNPCGMPECISREQLTELHPHGLALIPLGAVSSTEIHPLQGASTAAKGNKGRAIAGMILQEWSPSPLGTQLSHGALKLIIPFVRNDWMMF